CLGNQPTQQEKPKENAGSNLNESEIAVVLKMADLFRITMTKEEFLQQLLEDFPGSEAYVSLVQDTVIDCCNSSCHSSGC
ncbi:hypothetical protein X975_24297, partial [Stegodyphus mimosarum]